MSVSINHAILTYVLQSLKQGEIRQCESLGFTHEELNTLNNLSLDELFSLSRSATTFLTLVIQHDVLDKMLKQAYRETEMTKRLNKAIELGGSIELLNNYFGLTSNEVSAKRRLMGIKISQGRTLFPSEKDDAAIWHKWQAAKVENLNSMEALDTMFLITEELNSVSLTSVWNRIKEFKTD